MEIYSKISAAIITIAVLFQISGCKTLSSSNETSVVNLGANKSISLVSNSIYDEQIKLELEKQEFTIVSPNDSRYQLEAKIGNEVDWCQGARSRKLDNVIFKLKDKKNDKILFILENNGWSNGCEIYQTSIFTKLAKRLSERWASPNGTVFYTDLIYF